MGGNGLIPEQFGLIQTGLLESPTTKEALKVMVCIYTGQGQDSGMTRLQKTPFPDLSVHITFKLDFYKKKSLYKMVLILAF